MRPLGYRAGGSGNNRVSARPVTLLPLPLSPTIARVSPRAMEKLMPLTASITPFSVANWMRRSRISRSGSLIVNAGFIGKQRVSREKKSGVRTSPRSYPFLGSNARRKASPKRLSESTNPNRAPVAEVRFHHTNGSRLNSLRAPSIIEPQLGVPTGVPTPR